MAEENSGARNRSEQLELMDEIIKRSQKILAGFPGNAKGARVSGQPPDPLNLAPMVLELATKMMANPAALFQAQLSLWDDDMTLWQRTSKRLLGQAAAPMPDPTREDRQFRHPAWNHEAVFGIIKRMLSLDQESVISGTKCHADNANVFG